MINNWKDCKNILCIRADNMGDLIMSGPAIRALRQSFNAKITVLTSSMAAGIAKFMPEIDEVIIYDLPWIKADQSVDPSAFFNIIQEIKNRRFDGAIIFSVYSQNPLPAAMLAYLSEIPLRLAYARENPYKLLSHWIPDKEPYSFIRHQVKRDLNLVSEIGASVVDNHLMLTVSKPTDVLSKLVELGIDPIKPWIILHPGVSEKKREYPEELWVETAQCLINELYYQVLFTGGKTEKELTDRLQSQTGNNSFSVAGQFNLEEFASLIANAPLVISVNTGPVHIAAALNIPLIVLYALTNPQHFPWRSKGKIFEFSVPDELKSRNEVIKHVNEMVFGDYKPYPTPKEIISAAVDILENGNLKTIPELPEQLLSLNKVAELSG